MKKCLKRIGICFLIVSFVWMGSLIADRTRLRRELIRLHVVAASDYGTDQAIKLRVRDAVIESLRDEMKNLKDVDQAKAYLQENLPKIEAVANRVLQNAGCGDTATVQLCVEEFSKRVYDTFSLPAGLYESLRIIIGEGAGKNWWCVVFPELCMGATSEQFVETASLEGFDRQLCGTLTGEYEIRFWVLDQLGRLGNFLHRDSE